MLVLRVSQAEDAGYAACSVAEELLTQSNVLQNAICFDGDNSAVLDIPAQCACWQQRFSAWLKTASPASDEQNWAVCELVEGLRVRVTTILELLHGHYHPRLI